MGMWDVPRFTAHHLYEIVIVENVPRVVKGVHWNRWLRSMHDMGYLHEVIWLNSMHSQGMGEGAPQSRDRVYVTFWRAGNPRPDFETWIRPQAFCPEHGMIQTAQVMKPKGSPMKTYGAQYTLRCPVVSCNTEVFPDVAGAETIIDWKRKGIRISDRKSLGMDELAEKTMLRTFHGVKRHWAKDMIVEASGNQYDAADPKHKQHGQDSAYYRAWPAAEPLRTLHGTASKALIVNNVSGSDESRSRPVREPLPAIVAGGNHAALLVPVEGRDGKKASPTSAPMRTQSTRNETGLLVPVGGTWRTEATSTDRPMPTRTTTETDALVVPLRNHGVAKTTDQPIDTVAASGNHHALVIRQQNSRGNAAGMSTPVTEPVRTITAAGNQSLLTPGDIVELEFGFTDDEIWQMVYDAEFRMLEPDEIKRGMSFAADYVLLGNKREQVKMAGNAVTPNAARDIIAACVESLGYTVRRDLGLAA